MKKKIISPNKWYGHQNRGFRCRWIRWWGSFLVKLFQSVKKCRFSPFFGKKIFFSKNDKGIKIGVFDDAEYGGVVEFWLEPLPGEKNIIFWHFLIFFSRKMWKMIFFCLGGVLTKIQPHHRIQRHQKPLFWYPYHFFENFIFSPKKWWKTAFFYTLENFY